PARRRPRIQRLDEAQLQEENPGRGAARTARDQAALFGGADLRLPRGRGASQVVVRLCDGGLTLSRVDLGQELLDGHRGMPGAGRAEDVESMLCEWQFGVDDGLLADLPQPLDKRARLLDVGQ